MIIGKRINTVVTMSVTKDSTAMAAKSTKWPPGMHSGCLALTNVFLVFSLLSMYFEYDFHNK